MEKSPVRLVVCINERLGTGQRSCVGSGNLDYIAEVRSLISAHHLDVPIVEHIETLDAERERLAEESRRSSLGWGVRRGR